MISYQTEEHSDKDILQALNPLVGGWFKGKFGTFAKPQRYAVLNIHSGSNTLISAPTGTGKTFSAFISILSELVGLSEKGLLEDRVYCIYISPLKALNNDIERNLKEPLSEIKAAAKEKGKSIGVRVDVRTGDTPSSERAKMLRIPPHILITTPESLAITLNAPRFRQLLKDVRWVIVDEIHALAENKRGVHLSLSLERLQRLAGPFTRIGLSATIAPLDEVARFLVGNDDGRERDCGIVDAQFTKKLDLKVMSPLPDLINTTEAEMQDALYNTIDRLIEQHRTTLIFTNTRSATERVVHHLKTRFPAKYVANIGAHHSSLSRDHRLDIEGKLKEGKLKAVVSSTSLELGIDIGYIDLVILLGSPKSVARALQRVGRSGHKLHDAAKGRIIALDRDDLVECAVLLKSALERKLDKISIPENCLDVLAQHIYGIAIEDRTPITDVYRIVRSSYCYRALSREDFMGVVNYLAGTYADLESRNVYAKIWYDEETAMIGKRGRMARVLYSTNIGTIPDESFIKVKVGNKRIGEIDESFLEKLKRHDVFVLGGNTYRFLYMKTMTAQVIEAPNQTPTVPSWVSEMLPLSFDLSLDIQRFRTLMMEQFQGGLDRGQIISFITNFLYVDENAASAIYSYFSEQYEFSRIPHTSEILIEHYTDMDGVKHAIAHTLYGRRVNDVLSRAVALMLSKSGKRNIVISLTDNGFALTCGDKPLNCEMALSMLTPDNVWQVSEKAIERTEVFKRRFRHCATRSLMILKSYMGRKKTVGRQQFNAQRLLKLLEEISPDFPIIKETRREILHDLMDIENAKQVLGWISEGKVRVKTISTQIPTPFSLNMLARGYSDMVRMEDRLDFVKRMHNLVLAKIALEKGKRIRNEAEVLA